MPTRIDLPSALRLACFGIPTLVALAVPVGAAVRARAPDYERDVRPLFIARCGGCHSAAQPRAGLSIAGAADLLAGGASGPAVLPGNPEESLLYRMLVDGRMPKGPRLKPSELALVRDWIRAGARGAPGRGHWAFQPPRRPPLPPARGGRTGAVDRFIDEALERKALTLSPQADRRTLIRRLTFDLTGLPPTPEEVDAFLADDRPDAYERLVDRLLASPAYGERWARHWLDPAGYADSEGVLQEDRIRPNAWRYRDWVIRALNRDLPYDRFLQEQIAGDELTGYPRIERFTPEVVETLTATGFLRTAVDATRDDFNSHQYGEYQYRMLHDTQTIVMTTVLGLSMHCARCHDHKYEPLSQKDYYRIQALFTPAVRPRGKLLPSARRQIVAATAVEQEAAQKANAAVDAAVRELEARLAASARERALALLARELSAVPEPDRAPLQAAAAAAEDRRSEEQKALVQRYRPLAAPTHEELAQQDPEFARLRRDAQKDRAEIEKRRVHLVSLRAFYDQDAAPPPTPLLIRGEWLRPGEPVEPGAPALFDGCGMPLRIPSPPPGSPATGRRLAFARWLTDPRHPLTARVLVNRVWAHHFGQGLVATLDNFGRSGARPTHPELLDWLASVFTTPVGPGGPERGMGCSLKRLHRLIVTSHAYRQASRFRAEAAKVDPENRLLWRQRPRRLEAEAVRDAVLAVAGTLDTTMFGEPVGTETLPTGEVTAAGEKGRGRRSIYLLVRRSQPVTLLNLFDAPVMETNCTRRTVSTTPSQSLAVTNSAFYHAQAAHFVKRLAGAGVPRGRGTMLDQAYLLAYGRRPTAAERARSLDFLISQERVYCADGRPPAQAETAAWTDLAHTLLASNEFLYVD